MVGFVPQSKGGCLQAFGGMFCLSGLLGIYGSCATLAGYCMSRHFGVTGISVFKLKVIIVGFVAPSRAQRQQQGCAHKSIYASVLAVDCVVLVG